ncbi:MAG: guanylate kinase [Candidatus Desulforudis sp.]|nr:guanylate kinase [Desulforudis sp.]
MRGLLVVVSGPSGAGKGTVCQALCRRLGNIHLSVSATTRPPRAGEEDGVHYFFVNNEKFQEMIAQDELLEWARVYRDYYGTPRGPVTRMLESGRDVILEIDVQGALQVKGKVPEAVLVFLRPPSMEELERRLRLRGTDSEERIAKRLEWARNELEAMAKYDYVVVNDRVEEAVVKVEAIIRAEKSRSSYLSGPRT